jgi:hypothetical protein
LVWIIREVYQDQSKCRLDCMDSGWQSPASKDYGARLSCRQGRKNMNTFRPVREYQQEAGRRQGLVVALVIVASAALQGCGEKPPPAEPAPPAGAAAAQPALNSAAQPLPPDATTWTPEGLEELLAPVALYPDAVLGQVLVSASNPQEVLDAGNWLLQNQGLQGKALDAAAQDAGFTPPVRGLLQSPETVDMMASQMDWTTELGQAFVNDQAGVLAAVQRLRTQARDVGNLKSSEQLKVATVEQEGQQVVTVAPPSPQVVYVPQYDPVAVYAPPPAVVPAATTATKEGHSTGSMVATGLLSFGAGLLVANIFDDDDDDWYRDNYYSPRYYGPPMPYYPPNPYRPRYGNGYYPSSGYNRPPNYKHDFNNNTVVINQNNNYWNGRASSGPVSGRDSKSARSPISAAKPNRPELESLNASARSTPKRAAPPPPESWKGQSGYAGAKSQPKIQGEYAGAKPDARPAAMPAAKPAVSQAAAKVDKPAARPTASPVAAAKSVTGSDRGRPAADSVPQVSKPANRPAAAPAAATAPRPSAVSGASRDGAADKAAAQRGKESAPQGLPPKPPSAAKPAKPATPVRPANR